MSPPKNITFFWGFVNLLPQKMISFLLPVVPSTLHSWLQLTKFSGIGPVAMLLKLSILSTCNHISPLKNWFQTRIHSSRMRTVRCSGRLGKGGGVYPWGVSARGCLPRRGLPGVCLGVWTEWQTFPQRTVKMFSKYRRPEQGHIHTERQRWL